MHERNGAEAKAAAVGCVVVLGLIALGVWLFLSPPNEAKAAVRRLDATQNPDPADRVEAIGVILKLALEDRKLSDWQQIQEKGCRDADPQVRVAALRALAQFTKAKPDQVVTGFGVQFVYVNTDFLKDLGRSDPSPAVRAAVADYWGEADVLWKEGIDALRQMIDGEKDETVLAAVRAAFSRRVEQSATTGKLEKGKAEELRRQYSLATQAPPAQGDVAGPAVPKASGKAPETPADKPSGTAAEKAPEQTSPLMQVLAVVTFYASLVFGFGCGLVAAYRVGRIGLTQFGAWLRGAPFPKSITKEEGEAWAGLADIPTSPTDLLLGMTPIGWVKTVADLVTALYKHRGKELGYYSSMFGVTVGKLWYTVGLPFFILDLVLAHQGYSHRPAWLASVGLESAYAQAGVILGGYLLAYIVGSLVSSPQREYNRGRLVYEAMVLEKGYWFDHRHAPGHYADPHTAARLEQVRRAYEELLSLVENQGADETTIRQQLMTLHYQRALLFCTTGQLGDAAAALREARKLKAQLRGSKIWDPQEEDTVESQMLFLEGEIAFVEGRTADARRLFQESMAIDQALGDSAGVQKNLQRLQLVP